MKRITSIMLSLSIVALLSFAATGIASGNPNSMQNTTEELLDTAIDAMNGMGDPPWQNIAEGIGCGVMTVLTVATVPANLTGAGILPWLGLATSTVALCGAAFF
jgi:hypothetical protein